MGERAFASEASLVRAIKGNGFQNMPYKIVRLDNAEHPGGRMITAEFQVELVEDAHYIRDKGYRAKIVRPE